MAHEAATAERWGLTPADVRAGIGPVNGRVQQAIAQIGTLDDVEALTEIGADVLLGGATFTDQHTLRTGDREITAKFVLVVTGSRPAVPDVPGLAEAGYLTNEDAFDLADLPPRLAVIGGGPIAVELAQAFVRLGSQVTVLQRGQRLIPRDDPEMIDILHTAFGADGIDVRFGARVRSVRTEHGEKVLDLGDDEIRADAILCAVGRAPNTEDLGLEVAGVATTSRGITVNDLLQTSRAHIYAAGDVVGGPAFTHFAGYQAAHAVRNMFIPVKAKFSRGHLPWVTFTDPEVAHVGHDRARGRGGRRDVRHHPVPVQPQRARGDRRGARRADEVPRRRQASVARRAHRRALRRGADQRADPGDEQRPHRRHDHRLDPRLPDVLLRDPDRALRLRARRQPGHRPEARAVPEPAQLTAMPPLTRIWARFTHLVGGLLPGATARRIQVAAFEREWLAANSEAQGASGPLWVVLGDSGSQAIGATERRHGYVLSILGALRADDPSWRVVNLSLTGARVADVLDTQLPAIRRLPRPALVSVAIGTNDIRHRTPGLDRAMRTLLAALPPGSVVATIPQGVRPARARELNDLIRREAAERGLRVADLWAHTGPPWQDKFSADHFHPNDLGYADWTAAFLEALDIRAGRLARPGAAVCHRGSTAAAQHRSPAAVCRPPAAQRRTSESGSLISRRARASTERSTARSWMMRSSRRCERCM